MGETMHFQDRFDLVAHFRHARNAVTVRAGKAIFHAGERGTTMYILMEGSAAVLVGGELVDIALPGAVLGEMALLDEPVRSASVVARHDCSLVPVPREHFDLLLMEAPAFAREVMRSMAVRLRRMNARLAENPVIPSGDSRWEKRLQSV
jgi:CRP-like cAMP-binding protein